MSFDGFEFDDVGVKLLSDAIQSRRYLAASRSRLTVAEIATWDKDLVRELRLLVPIDLQALFVEEDSDEEMLRLPMLLADPAGVDLDAAMPAPFSPGTPRDAGVHLHWAMPDALLRGRMDVENPSATNRLGLASLPDRWVVLRVVLAAGAAKPHVRGWVLEAERALVFPLDGWSAARRTSDAKSGGVAIESQDLTGAVGGSVAWSGVYDAVKNRFAFHDPLEDLGSVAPAGVDRDSISYLVSGWWSDPESDPLDMARSTSSTEELLNDLRWRLMAEWGDARYLQELNDSLDKLRGPLGLRQNQRTNRTRTPAASKDRAKFTPVEAALTSKFDGRGSSRWAFEAGEAYETEPWHLRASLLHGAVYGVPVKRLAGTDRRPSTRAVRLALGEHDGDILATLMSVPGASVEERRNVERLVEAFAAQKINRMGSRDGIVEIETEEHKAGFSSVPGGTAGTDRFVQRAEPGKAGGSTQAKGRFTKSDLVSSTVEFAQVKNDLTAISLEKFLAQQWERLPITMSASESRVVERPAPRFGFPSDPVLAVQGAGRSLRHANDGRSSPDGKLTCRWPTQITDEKQGVLSGAELVPTLNNASVPPEVVRLVREVVLHDPYHARWLAEAADPQSGPASSTAVSLVHARLVAEAAVRFGSDSVYDGMTQAFAGFDAARQSTPRGRVGRAGLAESDLGISSQHQAQVRDQLMAFSLSKGADPDPVGVTCWSQPWIPLWIEWEASFDPPGRATLDGWTLGAVDLEPRAEPPANESRLLAGRALLTTGAATTLSRAVEDWLAAEDQRSGSDPATSGADSVAERALADLARAVSRPDIVTAALDGFRTGLLGIPNNDGVVRRGSGDSVAKPQPVEKPSFLASGRIRIERARLVDAFGRTLDLPVDAIQVTVRDSIRADRGALSFPPRLMRPARWRLRFVGADTAVNSEGVEARVDQVDPTLQVNPVAGFLLPDHLDESLEFFGVNGDPIGELLVEPVGGGVVWEIAPGRTAPPSSGPHFGLQAPQQPLGSLAAGLLGADAAHRAGKVASGESALSALLRAVDTTLWTVDTFAALGTEHVAGLVGRPIAVVRAQIRLQLAPPDDLDLSDPRVAAEWSQAERDLAKVALPVRIGDLTRTDDGVLGFFVDDDYTRFWPVDKVVAELASEGGRSRGQLGLFGQTPSIPLADPIAHPYLTGREPSASGDGNLSVHPGQLVTLTILMYPAGKVHLTSGVLPRSSISLAREWVGSGLAAVSPSLRTGPLLVESDLEENGQVRLPKVSVFGKNQDFWWRETPAAWRNDAILAATQSALLPDTPASVREGWIRVRATATEPSDPGGTS